MQCFTQNWFQQKKTTKSDFDLKKKTNITNISN